MGITKELLQQIVEGETIDDRMNIVDENPDIFSDDKFDAIQSELKIVKQELQEQKQKYRDRFFNNSQNQTKDEQVNEEESSNELTLEKLGF